MSISRALLVEISELGRRESEHMDMRMYGRMRRAYPTCDGQNRLIVEGTKARRVSLSVIQRNFLYGTSISAARKNQGKITIQKLFQNHLQRTK